MRLLRLPRRGSSVLVLAQWTRMVLQIVALVALSQLLPPTAFGLFAMVTAFTGIANVIGDFGLSLAALTGAPPDQNQRSKLFWTNAAVGGVLTVAVAGCAPLVSAYYHQPNLVGITLALSPVFALNALSVQFKVELNLRGAWRRLAVAETAGPLLGLLAAVVVASITRSYWALVLQPLLAGLVQLFLAVTLSGWRPTRTNSSTGIRDHLRFGRNTLGLQAFTYVSSNADNVLVGHSLGSAALGEYSRAYQLAMMPIVQVASPLTRVMLPRLAAARGTDRFGAEAARLQKTLCYALLAPLTFLIGTADPLVKCFLGSSWHQVPTLLEILALGAVFVAIAYIYYWLYLAVEATATLAITEGISRVVMVACMVVFVHRGSEAVAWSVAFGQVLLFVGSTAVAQWFLRIDARAVLIATFGPVVCYSAGAICAMAVGTVTSQMAPILAFGAQGLVWLSTCLLVAVAVPMCRADLQGLINSIRSRATHTPRPPGSSGSTAT